MLIQYNWKIRPHRLMNLKTLFIGYGLVFLQNKSTKLVDYTLLSKELEIFCLVLSISSGKRFLSWSEGMDFRGTTMCYCLDA